MNDANETKLNRLSIELLPDGTVKLDSPGVNVLCERVETAGKIITDTLFRWGRERKDDPPKPRHLSRVVPGWRLQAITRLRELKIKPEHETAALASLEEVPFCEHIDWIENAREEHLEWFEPGEKIMESLTPPDLIPVREMRVFTEEALPILTRLRAMGIYPQAEEDALQHISLGGPENLEQSIITLPVNHPGWFKTNAEPVREVIIGGQPMQYVPPPEPLPWNVRLNALTLQKNPEGEFVLTGPNTYLVIELADAMHEDNLAKELMAVVAQLKAEEYDEHVDFTPIPARMENMTALIKKYQTERESRVLGRGCLMDSDGKQMVATQCVECKGYVTKWRGEKAPVCLPCIELKKLRGVKLDRGTCETLFWDWYRVTDIKGNAVQNPMYETIARRAWHAALGLPVLAADNMKKTFTCPKCGRTSHNPNDAKHRYCGACNEFFVPTPPSDPHALSLIEKRKAVVSKRVWGPGDEYNVVEVQVSKFNAGQEADVYIVPTGGAPGEVCHKCGWTNVGCLNLGEAGRSEWVCHGCIKREHDAFKKVQDNDYTETKNATTGGPTLRVTFGAGRIMIGFWRSPTGEKGVYFKVSDEPHPIGKYIPSNRAEHEERGFLYFQIDSAEAAETLIQAFEDFREGRFGALTFREEIEHELAKAEGNAPERLILSAPYRISLLGEELARLQQGKFTPAELQNLHLLGLTSLKKYGELQKLLAVADATIIQMKNAVSHIHNMSSRPNMTFIAIQSWTTDAMGLADEWFAKLRERKENGRPALSAKEVAITAIADGDPGWEKIMIDGPAMTAVATLRISFEKSREDWLNRDRERATAYLSALASLNLAINAGEIAWGLIANASGGDWEKETPEWREAAGQWRDRFHGVIMKLGLTPDEATLREYRKPAMDAFRRLIGEQWSPRINETAKEVLSHYGEEF